MTHRREIGVFKKIRRDGRRAGRFYRALFGIAAALTLLGLTLYTEQSRETAGKAAAMCMELILPSLFPYLVLTGFLIGLGFAEELGRPADRLMRRVFRLNGACAAVFLMGAVGGYPVGARAAIAAYRRGACGRAECERMLAFCSNAGPAFILGVVGTGIFADSRAGLLLWLCHLAASLTVGLLFRFYKRGEPVSPCRAESGKTPGIAAVFVDSVRGALQGVAGISAFVIFFAVAVNLLFASGFLPLLSRALAAPLSPFGVNAERTEQLLVGMIEMTSGLHALRGAGEAMEPSLSMAAFLLGWAGVSVHCQVLSFLGDSGLSLLPYLGGKALHALLSALYAAGLARLFPAAVPASALAQGQVELLRRISAGACLRCVPVNCAFLLLLFLLFRLGKKFADGV